MKKNAVKQLILVTLGEIESINVEIFIKAFFEIQKYSKQQDYQFVLIGNLEAFQNELKFLKIKSFFDFKNILFIDHTRSPAEASFASLEIARDIYLQDPSKIRGFLTLPIDKSTCQQAGFAFPGQTEFFTDLARVKVSIMLLASKELKVGLVTQHCAVKDISKKLSQKLIKEKITLLAKTLQDYFKIRNPKIAVCGLNPHASDNGLFGDEEEKIIIPAIRESEFKVLGPFSADTVFYEARQKKFDAVLAMYHDQGLAPLKTVSGYAGINVTGGLPFLRVSPDHGPARDLYRKNKADYRGVLIALKLLIGELSWE